MVTWMSYKFSILKHTLLIALPLHDMLQVWHVWYYWLSSKSNVDWSRRWYQKLVSKSPFVIFALFELWWSIENGSMKWLLDEKMILYGQIILYYIIQYHIINIIIYVENTIHTNHGRETMKCFLDGSRQTFHAILFYSFHIYIFIYPIHGVIFVCVYFSFFVFIL